MVTQYVVQQHCQVPLPCDVDLEQLQQRLVEQRQWKVEKIIDTGLQIREAAGRPLAAGSRRVGLEIKAITAPLPTHYAANSDWVHLLDRPHDLRQIQAINRHGVGLQQVDDIIGAWILAQKLGVKHRKLGLIQGDLALVMTRIEICGPRAPVPGAYHRIAAIWGIEGQRSGGLTHGLHLAPEQ